MTIERDRSRVQTLLVRAGTATWLALGIVLLVLAVRGPQTAAGTTANTPASQATARLATTRAAADTLAPGTQAYVPDYEFRSGDEIVLVFIGASFCGAQRKPGFPAVVEQAKVALAGQARTRQVQFRAHAVSLDWKPAEAMAFLEHFGAFDEISIGSNWLNDGAVRYIWRDLPSEPAVPQIIVLQRHVETGGAVSVRDERVLRRLLGTDQITRWVAEGAQI
jgi:hypothetical protein